MSRTQSEIDNAIYYSMTEEDLAGLIKRLRGKNNEPRT